MCSGLGTNYSNRVMCHASNTLWALEQVDESLVEKPVAPGGATGGVEFEAMNYVVSLSIGLNNCLLKSSVDYPFQAPERLCRTAGKGGYGQGEAITLRFDGLWYGQNPCGELCQSVERQRELTNRQTFRKASTTYYPCVHLQLARYVRLLQEASPSGRLPYLISKMVGPPPEEVAKAQYKSGHEWLPMPTVTSRRS